MHSMTRSLRSPFPCSCHDSETAWGMGEEEGPPPSTHTVTHTVTHAQSHTHTHTSNHGRSLPRQTAWVGGGRCSTPPPPPTHTHTNHHHHHRHTNHPSAAYTSVSRQLRQHSASPLLQQLRLSFLFFLRQRPRPCCTSPVHYGNRPLGPLLFSFLSLSFLPTAAASALLHQLGALL